MFAAAIPLRERSLALSTLLEHLRGGALPTGNPTKRHSHDGDVVNGGIAGLKALA